jgi:hypothetical protein
VPEWCPTREKRPAWQAAVRGILAVGRYLELIRWQAGALPANYAKLRFVENHDNFRIMAFARTRARPWP